MSELQKSFTIPDGTFQKYDTLKFTMVMEQKKTMNEQQVKELILKVNNAFKVDLRDKKMTRLSTYLRMIITSKTNLHDVVIGKLINRDRITVIYYKRQFSQYKNFDDFKDLIKKVEQLN